MALRRRDWTASFLQIISFLCDSHRSRTTYLEWKYIIAYFLYKCIVYSAYCISENDKKMIKSNVSVLLMQFMEIIVYSMCIIGILSFFVSDSFNRNIYVSSAICFAFAVYITDRRLKKSDIDGEHIPVRL